VKTINSESDPAHRFNSQGRYIVRTIELDEINRIRIRIDDDEVWKVRYNNYADREFVPQQANFLQVVWGRLSSLFS